MIEKVFYLISIPLKYILYFTARFIKRDNNIWLFGSWNGNRFSDNSRSFYLYMNSLENNENRIKCIWITKSRSVRRNILANQGEVYLKYSPKGLYYLLKAGIYIFDSYTRDISFWTSNGVKKVLLFHGIPMKKIGRDINVKSNLFYKCYHGSFFNRIILRIIFPWWVEKYNFISATSSYTKDIFKSAFNSTDNEVIITGFPRNDQIFKLYKPQETINSRILYMPTFRDSQRIKREIPINWVKMNELMLETNSLFYIKLHPNEKFDIDLSTFERIKVIEKESDIYPQLNKYDILITDYSSIAFDFLLLERPVIFYCYDLDSYIQNDRNLYINYLDLLKDQEVCKTSNNLLETLTILISNSDSYKTSKKFVNLFHQYKDSNACFRIKNEIINRFVN